MPKLLVGVMGPGDAATAADLESAQELGMLIAREGWVLLTGGRHSGVMHAASHGAKRVGGLTIGILPGGTLNDVSPDVDVAVVTGLGEARNAINVLSSRVVFVCGSSSGTASEIALALKTQRPTILVGPSKESLAFWSSLDSLHLHVAANASEAIRLAKRLVVPDSVPANP